MTTALISHDDCLAHDTGIGHPENAGRIRAINDRLMQTQLFDWLAHVDAPLATREALLRAHTPEHVDKVFSLFPREDSTYLDPDTVACPQSLTAALRAAGAVVEGVDRVMRGDNPNAFCLVRPPGHHAESDKPMGFCFFNNVAVGVGHLLKNYPVERIAVLDFDVHQGNGTEEIFLDDERIIFCSTYQHPFYPHSPVYPETYRQVSIPLDATAKSEEFRAAVTDHWLPALERFEPEFIFISAGFDAHRDDDMSSVSLTDADYQWVTEKIMAVAEKYAGGRVVSSLEGGYEYRSLARSVERHLRVLMGQQG
ncbi:histone deacetylase family protein [Marinobacterium sp. xm-d-564]|uniref:histone deacetylase family protein n=1 Tax=Marinobacterium sp. xm-d-564 TaxID=2497742 RepID=UPI0015696F16|nr:histone deacetylase family protein [Marinobacterium sp. xm-d-564]NRP58780.1 Histone deacetylase-like amidohydrolase [Marinobacterium sp. xm-d-564]